VSQPVFLFDIDGVLVAPGGYRRATQSTLDFFTRRMGIADQILSEETFSVFESQNITSEWDTVPLCLAAILDHIQADYPYIELPDNLYQACDVIRSRAVPTPRVDYHALAARVGSGFQQGYTFAKLALMLNDPDQQNPPYPHLLGQPILDSLLEHTLDLTASPTTKLFQQFVLGSRRYQETYGLPAEIESESYLRTYDKPMLSPVLRQDLLVRWHTGKLSIAAYTLRPSRNDDHLPVRYLSFSPEANIALEELGFEEIPMVGYGQVDRTAELTGVSPRQIAKPSPIQALGALGAALFRDEMQAMLAATRWISQGDSDFFQRLPALDIHIFEDSAASIEAVRRVSEMLIAIGVPATLHAWGISQNRVKIVALKRAQAEVCADVNAAVDAALACLAN
jgi:hypothetical protein